MPPFRAAILCGGGGTRLWPLSSQRAPKQFHPLAGNQSLLTETIARAVAIPDSGRPLLLTSRLYADAAVQHARQTGVLDIDVFLEPEPRNTAPAAALAALAVSEGNPATVVALLPSDHHIADTAAFSAAMATARVLADAGHIVTVGIVPNAGHTGYGYIRKGEPLGAGFKVDRFVEKPDAVTAGAFVQSGEYLWNAGIFLFRADVLLAELARHRPDILQAVRRAWMTGERCGQATLVGEAAWAECPSASIDCAIAENTDRAAVVPAAMGWSDVGSWASLHDIGRRDRDRNVLLGEVVSIGSENCYVRSTGRRIAVIGVKNLIVVETDDGVVVVDRDASQDVKLVEQAFRSILP